jgi:hypothetical protein
MVVPSWLQKRHFGGSEKTNKAGNRPPSRKKKQILRFFSQQPFQMAPMLALPPRSSALAPPKPDPADGLTCVLFHLQKAFYNT